MPSIREITHSTPPKPPSDRPEPVDINATIRVAVAMTRSQWARSARVELDLDEALEPVPCRRAEINHVLSNLITNAVWAIGAAGRNEPGLVHISSRALGDRVEIRVDDDGIGIGVDDRGRVFDLLFTTNPPGEGTRQGLATCHAIVVQQHGGTIEVDSAPGGGASFRITLPLDPEDARRSGLRLVASG